MTFRSILLMQNVLTLLGLIKHFVALDSFFKLHLVSSCCRALDSRAGD